MNRDNITSELAVSQITTQPLVSWVNTNNEDTSKGKIISDQIMMIGQIIICTIVCLSIDICGTVANIINIICFVKQGFKDPVNVSLLGLAISDLGCLVPLIWTNICLVPTFSDADLPFDPVGVQSLTGSWPHLAFARITAWMTALITLERCMCVTSPLKVKSLITPKRVTVITVSVFIILVSSMAPIYVVNRLEMIFIPAKNKTVIGLVFTENRETTEKISFTINNVLVTFSAFIVIIVCTTILAIKLRKSTKWRKTITQTDKLPSSRHQKVSKMVVIISTLFVACFVPVVIIFVAMVAEPEISINGRYRNCAFLLGGLSVLLESVNSSMNICIYYQMSRKYRDTFRQLFHCRRDI